MPEAISYVIRTKDAIKTLPRVLDKLLLHAKAEAIVCVDSGSRDGTAEHAAERGCRLIRLEGAFGYGRALNVGFQACDSDWIVALSAHCFPARDSYHMDVVRTLRAAPQEVSMVAGTVIQSRTRVPVGDDLVIARAPTVAVFPDVFIGNPNCAYRRRSWANRPFDEKVPTNEDRHWCLSALAASEAVAVSFAFPVFYRHTSSPWGLFKKNAREAFCAQRDGLQFQVQTIQSKCRLAQITRAVAAKSGRIFGRGLAFVSNITRA